MTGQHGGDELGRIVERDREAGESFERSGSGWEQAIADRRYLLGLLREARTEIDYFANDDSPDVRPDDMDQGEWDQIVLTYRRHDAKAADLLARLAALEGDSNG